MTLNFLRNCLNKLTYLLIEYINYFIIYYILLIDNFILDKHF